MTVEFLGPEVRPPVTREYDDAAEARRHIESAKTDPGAWHICASNTMLGGRRVVTLSLYRSFEKNEWRDTGVAVPAAR